MCLETLVQEISTLEAKVDVFFNDTMGSKLSMADDDFFSEVRNGLFSIVTRARKLKYASEISQDQYDQLLSRTRTTDIRMCRVEQHYYGYLASA